MRSYECRSERKKREKRKIAESRLQQNEWCRSDDAIADAMVHVDHDDVLDVGVGA
jgi:hypothetical protein